MYYRFTDIDIARRHRSAHGLVDSDVYCFSSTAPRFPHISSILVWPLSPRVISASARSDRSTSSTPCSPLIASPYMNGRPTAIENPPLMERSWPISGKHVLTQDALCAHRNRLDHVASLTDPRVEQHREISFFLRIEHSRRLGNLLKSRERRNRAVNLPSTCQACTSSD